MPDWVNLGPMAGHRPGRGTTLEVEGLRLAAFRVDADIVVLSDRCPHAGGSLGQGWIEEGEVVCPLHRWRFRLGDGRCTTMRGHGVHRFPAEFRGDDLWVCV